MLPPIKIKSLLELGAGKNRVADVTALAGLELLETLRLEGNNIKDAAPIASLERLSSINLASNQLETLPEFRRSGALEVLILDQNKISDVKPLGANVEANTSTTPGIALRRLRTLILSNNLIQEAKILGSVPNVIYLDLAGTPLGEKRECPLRYQDYCQF